jgi:lysophospholipase L1-like esterase
VNQLHDRLLADGLDLPIVNLSASGARVSDVLEQQLPAWRGLPPAPGSPDIDDVITVLIGSNDLLSKLHREALPGQFARLLAELPRGSVIATMPQPRAAAGAVNELLSSAAERGEVTLVDLRGSGPASWRGRLAADHFHPNERGYASIAEAFFGPVLATVADQLPLS